MDALRNDHGRLKALSTALIILVVVLAFVGITLGSVTLYRESKEHNAPVLFNIKSSVDEAPLKFSKEIKAHVMPGI